MLTFDLTPLAKQLGCLPQLEAASGKDLSRVGWQFLGLMLREMPDADAQIVDPVIAGMDRLAKGEDWPEAAAAAEAAWATWAAAVAAMAAQAARAAEARAAEAAVWARRAGLPYARQREILVRLMDEATELGGEW